MNPHTYSTNTAHISFTKPLKSQKIFNFSILQFSDCIYSFAIIIKETVQIDEINSFFQFAFIHSRVLCSQLTLGDIRDIRNGCSDNIRSTE